MVRRSRESVVGSIAPIVQTVACGLGFALIYVVTVRTAPGREFGDASLRGAAFTQLGGADVVDRILAVVSVASLLAGIAAVSMIALVRLRKVAGLTGVGLVVVANASTWLLKTHLLSRPDLGLVEVTPATHNSLPSGHTTAVFSVVVALMIVVPQRLRPSVAIVGGAAAVATALATMSAGWHRAGDSIAAFLLVGTWAGVAALVQVLGGATDPAPGVALRRRGRSSGRTVMLGTLGAGLLLALCLVLIRPLRTSTVGELVAFAAGGVLILAAAIAVLYAERLVLERTDPA